MGLTLWISFSKPSQRLRLTSMCKSASSFIKYLGTSSDGIRFNRGLAERSIASVLKTEVGNTTIRSNRIPSIFSEPVTQLAECQFSKLDVAGSTPVWLTFARLTQWLECLLYTQDVGGSTPSPCIFWDVVQWLERAVDNRQTKVQFFPSQPFSGGFFQWQETRFASEQWGFDSPRLHHFTKDSSMVEQPAEDGRIVVQFHFLRPYCRILFWLNRTVS